MLLLLIHIIAADYLPDLSSYTTTSVCSAYSCATSKIQKPFSNSCISPYSATQTYLWECPADSTANFCNTTSMSCQVPKALPSLAYVGEACVSTSDCYLSSCFQGACKGLSVNTKCTSHEQCDLGLRCSAFNFTCQGQIPVNATGCRSYMDCVNWATCNMTYTSQNGTCIEYSSLQNSKRVTDCSGSFSYMCASGYCLKKYNFDATGVCSSPPVSNFTLPKICTSDSNCTGVMNGLGVNSQCVCGFNLYGNKYCTPFIGDPPGQDMLISWNRALKLTGKCNTARRGSSGCMEMTGKLQNTTQATLGFYYYSRYIGNDACIKSIYNADYYSAGLGLQVAGVILAYLYL